MTTTSTAPDRTLSVVIPAFNEAARIGSTLDRLQTYLPTLSRPSEIVVVDDGSTDDTVEVASARHSSVPLRVIRNGGNRGKGYSVRHGFRAARGGLVLISDADLSTPIEEVEKLLPLVEADRHALAIGSRAHPEARIEIRQPWMREQMGKTFNRIIRVVTGLPFRDTQCGFKLARREAIAPVFDACRIDRFCYDVELIYLALRYGLRVAEVPVIWRDSPTSRVRVIRDSSRMLIDSFRIVWLHAGRGPGSER